MSPPTSHQPCGASHSLRRLTEFWDYALLWGLTAGGLYLMRPRAGADPEEYWLFALWNVLLLSLCGHMLRARRAASADHEPAS